MAAFTSQAFVFSVILFFFSPISEAKDILAGGSVNGWQIPTTDPDALKDWTEKNTFDSGDYLVWNFEDGDSALEVKEEDYENCNTTYPIMRYEGLNNRALLYRNGTFFFISGSQSRCQMGVRLKIQVRPSEAHFASLYSSRGLTVASPGFTPMAAILLFTVLAMLGMVRSY